MPPARRPVSTTDAMAQIRGANVLKPESVAGEPTDTDVRLPPPKRTASATVMLDDSPQRDRQASGPSQPMTMHLPAIEEQKLREQLTSPGGVEIVSASSERARIRGRRFTRRALPLLSLSALAIAALSVAVVSFGRTTEVNDAAAIEPTELSAPVTVRVPAIDLPVGLSEGNKESVINLCWRVSQNPMTECRLDYYRDMGEYPERLLSFPDLDVMRTEVSNAEFEECVSSGVCQPRALDECKFYTIYRHEWGEPVPEAMLQPDSPAICVTYHQAVEFCASHDMRLPTADEWERIARSQDDRLQPWGTFWTPALLNWGERDMLAYPIPGRLDGNELTAPVEDYEDGRSEEGALQLFGNVAEWVSHPLPGYAYDDDSPMRPEALEQGMREHAALDESLAGRVGLSSSHTYLDAVSAALGPSDPDDETPIPSEMGPALASQLAEVTGQAGLRGGDYTDDALGFRITRVEFADIDEARSTVGFRCVRAR